jgi:GNAT superfamily N-acetyltransferase
MYPEVERRWFLFKNERMRARVIEWYNGLRESWGLEKLAETYTDVSQETDELLLADFVFTEYGSATDASDVESGLDVLVDGNSELDGAKLFLLKHHSNISRPEKKDGFVCRNQAGEFVGCLLISKCPPESEEAVIVTDFFVAKNYRGLGIGRMLISKILAVLTDRKIRFCFASGMLVPETFRLTFEQFGFKKNGPGFILCCPPRD